MRGWLGVGWVAGTILVAVSGCSDHGQSRVEAVASGMGGAPSGPISSGPGGAASPAGTGGQGSPTGLPSPASSFPPGSLCEPDGWCWYNPLPSGDSWQDIAGAGSDLWMGALLSPNLLHFNGGRWSSVVSPLRSTEGIWAAAPDDVWFAGENSSGLGGIAHWDGTAVTLALTTTNLGFNEIWGSSATDVYATTYGMLWHWDGSTWSPVPGVDSYLGVSGSGPNDVWVGGNSGGLLHFDGTSWSPVPELEGVGVGAVTVAAPGDVWVLAELPDTSWAVEHLAAGVWSVSLSIPRSTMSSLTTIGSSSPQDVWLLGTSGSESATTRELGYLNHFDGTTWTPAPLSPTVPTRMRHTAFGDMAVGGEGGILRLTSGPAPGFTPLQSGPAEDLLGVWGSSPSDMWAVGGAGTVLHYDGSAVASVPVPTSVDLNDVWGTGPNEVWTVGNGGTVLHFDGTAFAPVSSGTTANLQAVFTAAPNDVWFGGEGATLLHGTGGSISPVTLPGVDPSATVLDLHGLGTGDVWLSGGTVTGTGFVAHFDGSAWSPVQGVGFSFAPEPIERIWELAPNDVWALTRGLSESELGYWHFDGSVWTGTSMMPTPEVYMFPPYGTASFVFGPHDRWFVAGAGWKRNTN